MQMGFGEVKRVEMDHKSRSLGTSAEMREQRAETLEGRDIGTHLHFIFQLCKKTDCSACAFRFLACHLPEGTKERERERWGKERELRGER